MMQVFGVVALVLVSLVGADVADRDGIHLFSSMYVTPNDNFGIQIQSLNYPSPATSRLNQTWVLSTDPKAVMTVKCDDVSMTKWEPCGEFGLKIQDGDELTEVCDGKPFDMVTKTSQIVASFRLGPHAPGKVHCKLHSKYT